jgi:hypothetical protein
MKISRKKLNLIIENFLNEQEEKLSDHIKNQDDGNEFRSWVNKNYSDVAKRIDLDPTGSFNNKYIESAWKELGDEYVKIKKEKAQKKKNLSTGGILTFMKGKNPDGTYPAGRGMENPYYKFVKDDSVIAIDVISNKMGQLERGKGGNFITESEKKLFENILKRRIHENTVSVSDVLSDVKQDNVKDSSKALPKYKDQIINALEKMKQIADKASGRAQQAKNEWTKFIDVGSRGNDRAVVEKIIGKVKPLKVEGEEFIDYAIKYWTDRYAKGIGHGGGLAFDMVPTGGSSFKDINKVIIDMKKFCSGFSVLDETAEKPVKWNSSTSPVMTAESGKHYHFTISKSFKLVDKGVELAEQGEAMVSKLGSGSRRNFETLIQAGRNAFQLFIALCNKREVKVVCTSGARTAEAQTRIVIQQFTNKVKGPGGPKEGKSWLTTNYGTFGKNLYNSFMKSKIADES